MRLSFRYTNGRLAKLLFVQIQNSKKTSVFFSRHLCQSASLGEINVSRLDIFHFGETKTAFKCDLPTNDELGNFDIFGLLISTIVESDFYQITLVLPNCSKNKETEYTFSMQCNTYIRRKCENISKQTLN